MQLTLDELRLAICIGEVAALTRDDDLLLEMLPDDRKKLMRTYIAHKYGKFTPMPSTMFYNYEKQKRIE